MTWEWRQYQSEDIDRAINEGQGKALIALPLGAGKTAVATEVVRRMKAGVIMVTAPVNTHAGWARHFGMFMPELPIHYINADTQEAVLAKAKAGEHGVYIVGWEYGRGVVRYKKGPDGKRLMVPKGSKKVAVVDEVIREPLDWSKIPLDAAIIDESARMGNRKSSQTKVVHTAKNAPIKLCLSATPAGNKIENLWSTLHFLWPERYRYYTPWADLYLVKVKDVHATRYSKAGMVFTYDGEKEPGRVRDSIPLYLKRTEEEVHDDLPGVVTHIVPVELTAGQRRIYKQFEEEALAWLGEHPVAAALPITKMIRLRETMLAVPSVNDGDGSVYFKDDAKSSKIDMLLDIMTDLPEGEQVLVWTHSRKIVGPTIDRLQKAGYAAAPIIGGQSKGTRANNLQAFKDGDIQILVATVPALGEGADGLQNAAAVEVWLSHDESLMLNVQARGRLFRPGQTKVVNRYVIVAEDTIETRQLGRLKTTENRLTEGGML